MTIIKRAILIALFIFITPLFAAEKLPKSTCNKIVNFTLFNFDNLIADHFEGNGMYAAHLAMLLADSTSQPDSMFLGILNDRKLNEELNAVKYMLNINQSVKRQTGFYFVYQ